MEEIDFSNETVRIDDLVQRVAAEEAVATWRGYASIRPAEMSRRPADAIFVNADGLEPWLQSQHTAVDKVRDLGLYFLPNALVTGHGFVFHDTRFVVDDSTPNAIALQYAQQDGLLGAVGRQFEVIDIDQPVLVAAGPGYPIWGHWLLDFLPRVKLAQCALGEPLDDILIPVPKDTPQWVYSMVSFFCGIGREKFITYDLMREAVRCRRGVCLPTYPHSNYFLHSYCRELYQTHAGARTTTPATRICVSRRKFSKNSRSISRAFREQDYFEEAARSRGYLLVYPEEFDISEQIQIFVNARAIVGEYGSGMHNAIFSGEGTIVGQFVMPNTIQSRIAGLCGHKSLYLMPDNDPKFDSGVPVSLEVSEESIDEFLAIMEDEIKETEEGSESENRQTRMSAPLSPPAYLTRAQVLQPILSLFGEPRYLEIGVHSGDTFFEVTAARKVAVDREFFFDIEAARAREPHSAFFEVESDAYFGELILPGEKFDVIYLDGLHTFEQTLRDFCNSLHYLSNDGVIVIDDVVPNSYAAALPNVRTSERLKGELNDPDQSWMGDVYRLVFFIDSFFQQYNFATVVENHGQLVVWREPRRGAALRHRRIEQVARAPFESIITERDAFRRTGYAEIIAMLRRDRTP